LTGAISILQDDTFPVEGTFAGSLEYLVNDRTHRVSRETCTSGGPYRTLDIALSEPFTVFELDNLIQLLLNATPFSVTPGHNDNFAWESPGGAIRYKDPSIPQTLCKLMYRTNRATNCQQIFIDGITTYRPTICNPQCVIEPATPRFPPNVRIDKIYTGRGGVPLDCPP